MNGPLSLFMDLKDIKAHVGNNIFILPVKF